MKQTWFARCRRAWAVLAAASPALVWVSPAVAQDDPLLAKVRQETNAALHVRDSIVTVLDFDRTPGLPISVEIPLAGQAVTLDLAPYSVRDPGYRVIEQIADGSYRDVKPGPINTLRGEVRGMDGSVVAGGVMPDGLTATIVLADGTRFLVEPIEGRVAGAAPGAHAVYAAEDIAGDGVHHCGNDEFGLESQSNEPDPGGVRGATRYFAQLACDADFEYFSHYGSTFLVEQRINIVINAMNIQYERDVDIQHQITTVLVRTAEPDPYSSTNSDTLLDQFRSQWNSNHGGISRDTAQLFTGKEVDGSIIGLAFVGVICSGDAYGLVQSDFDGNFGSATDLSAHELGHNWNASHCSCSSPPFTMNPFITAINRFGGPAGTNGSTDIASIVGHRNFRAGFPFFCIGTGGGGSVPGNDECGSAVPLGPGSTAFSNVGATTDGPAACASIGNDVWYTYDAPCDGTVTINTCDSNYDSVLAVYAAGCGPTQAQEVACNDDTSGCGIFGIRGSSVSFGTTRGTHYLVRVAGFSGATGSGVLALGQTACPAPTNDACSNAQPVFNGFPVAFSSLDATTDGPVENLNCGFFGYSQIGSDLWFEYTALCTGTTRVSLCGSSFDTKLAVYGSCPSGANQAIACNDDNGPACSGLDSSVDFGAAEGNTYLIRVGGYNAAVGNGTVRVDSLSCPRPANDDCAGAFSLDEGVTGVPFDLTGASNDGSASCGLSDAARDVWFFYTAAVPGTLTVRSCGTNDFGGVDTGVDTVISLHSGCPSSGGVQLACNDDAFGGPCGGADTGDIRDSSTSTGMTAGQTVLVRVAPYADFMPNKQFRLSTIFVPANDACAGAFALPLCPSNTVVELHGANNEGAVSSCGNDGPNRDVWYTFTAPLPGTLTVSTCGTHDRDGVNTGTDTVVGVYAGCGGALIACNDDAFPACSQDTGFIRDSRVSAALSAGQTVRVRVSHFSASAVPQRRLLLQSSFSAANDSCAAAFAVSDGSYPLCTVGTTNDGPPTCGAGANDVWFDYTAPCTGTATADTCTSGFDTVLAVYSAGGCPVTQGREIACNDDTLGCGFIGIRGSRVAFAASAGAHYLIRVAGFSGVTGDATLTLACVPACPCDWNGFDGLDSQDFFDFISDFFAGNADFNGVDGTDSQDYFDFIECFIAGCE